jgi:aminoglycoside 6'-N-acetyltransferase
MRNDTAEYELMAKWLTDPRVLEFYEGRDNPYPLARIVNEYSRSVLYSQGVTPCFLISKGGPIGYMQFCPVASEEDLLSYGLEATDAASNIFGLDQFIGEPEYWDRGIGTRAVQLMLSYLFTSKQACRRSSIRMLKISVPFAVTTSADFERSGFSRTTSCTKACGGIAG